MLLFIFVLILFVCFFLFRLSFFFARSALFVPYCHVKISINLPCFRYSQGTYVYCGSGKILISPSYVQTFHPLHFSSLRFLIVLENIWIPTVTMVQILALICSVSLLTYQIILFPTCYIDNFKSLN